MQGDERDGNVPIHTQVMCTVHVRASLCAVCLCVSRVVCPAELADKKRTTDTCTKMYRRSPDTLCHASFSFSRLYRVNVRTNSNSQIRFLFFSPHRESFFSCFFRLAKTKSTLFLTERAKTTQQLRELPTFSRALTGFVDPSGHSSYTHTHPQTLAH